MALSKAVVEYTENYLHREVEERKQCFVYPFFWCIGQLYRFGIFWRHCFFDIGILPQRKVTKPVISVGNITTGGSGKTPFVKMLAKDMRERVSILHRGYRSEENWKGLIQEPSQGDEAYMLSKGIPEASVYVGKNRILSALTAEDQDIAYHILDDGMQYRYLQRDLEIVIVHKDDLLNQENFLPSGLLRDSPRRLKKAAYIVINRVTSQKEFTELKKEIRKYSEAPIIGTGYTVVNENEIQGKVVGAFCGIARPKGFYSMLHRLGCRIVHSETIGDHRALASPDKFVKDSFAAGAEIVVCTEKDYVKLGRIDNVVPLKIEMEVLYGEEHYFELINLVRSLIKGNP